MSHFLKQNSLRTSHVFGETYLVVIWTPNLDIVQGVFLTGPPLKFSKYKISKKCPDWASPGPPQKVKVHGLGLP